MASSSHTIALVTSHTLPPNPSNIPTSPFSLARSSARIALSLYESVFAHETYGLQGRVRSGHSNHAIGHDFSRLRLEYQISLSIIAVLSQSVWQGKILHREFRSRV